MPIDRNTAPVVAGGLEIVERDVRADPRIEHEVDAEAADDLDFAIEDRLGQPIFRQGEAQHAAGFGVRVVDGDLVAQQREIEARR